MKLAAGLQRHLIDYRKNVAFDPKAWTGTKIDKFADYLKNCGLKSCVVSVSGGIDSAVTLGLCAATQRRYPEVLKNITAVT